MTRMKRYFHTHCLWVLILFLFGVSLAMGQDSPIKTGLPDAALDIEVIPQKIKDLEISIEKASRSQGDKLVQEFGIKPEDEEIRLSNLISLKTSYEKLAAAVEGIEGIEKENSEFQARYEHYRQNGMAKRPPYPLTFHDSLLAERFDLEKNGNTIDISMDLVRKSMEDDITELEAVNKSLRLHRELLDKAQEEEKSKIVWAIDMATLVQEYLKIRISARKTELKKMALEKELITQQMGMINEQEAFVRSNLQYDDEDLARQLANIDQLKESLHKEMGKNKADLNAAEIKWMAARQRFEKATQVKERDFSDANLKAREEWRKTYSVMLEIKEETLVMLDRQKAAWQQRYFLIKETLSPDQLSTLQKQTERIIGNINQSLQIQQTYLVSIQKKTGALQGLMQNEGIEPEIKRSLSSQIDALRLRLEKRLEHQSVILSTDQIEKRLFDQIKSVKGKLTVTDHVSGLKEKFREFWRIEIWVVDDRPVSLGKILVAFLILAVGFIVARFVLNVVRVRFLEKSQFKETTASAVHKMLSYAAYLLVVLFALRIVNIPLTAFAFLGGAVAIGVGFGAQNLINNFISGFMILGERPINIGDLIEVDGLLGKVEEIGARCTRVRTGENVHKLVPNSSFLERNITNWTLSDNTIRTKISLGVAYGSPVRIVEKLLVSAAKENSRVLKTPEPFVLFSEFGDNALVFELYFWVMIHLVLEKKQVESAIRFKIDELFNKEGIVIAFPQSDVHLDQKQPFAVQIIKPE